MNVEKMRKRLKRPEPQPPKDVEYEDVPITDMSGNTVRVIRKKVSRG